MFIWTKLRQSHLFTQRIRTFCDKTPQMKVIQMSFAAYETNEATNLPPVVIIHGLLGTKRNWRSICKNFSKNITPQRKLIAVDCRNHGESPHTDEHSYEHMVADLYFFLNTFGIKKVCLIGHSMGGMMVMYFALKHSDVIEKLIVVDIAPKKVAIMEEIKHIVETIAHVKLPKNVPMPTARSTVEQQLQPLLKDAAVRQFILTNLTEQRDGRYTWTMNLEVLKRYLMKIMEFPDPMGLKCDKPALFIGGAQSEMITKDDHEMVTNLFPLARFFYVEGAGHWVHSEKPNEFSKACVDFINELHTT